MIVLSEVRKEDDSYFCGPFWIIANSLDSIMSGKFTVCGEKFLCDYERKISSANNISKNQMSHENLWKNKYAALLHQTDKPYNYFPRGRVAISNGKVFIHLNSTVNIDSVRNRIIDNYELDKFSSEDITIELNDIVQGSHYDFLLK